MEDQKDKSCWKYMYRFQCKQIKIQPMDWIRVHGRGGDEKGGDMLRLKEKNEKESEELMT